MARLPNDSSPVACEVGVVDEHARAEAERAEAAAGLGGDHAANLERLRADEDAIADAQVELRQQLRPHERAAPASAASCEYGAVAQRQRAVERKRRLHGPQLHHLVPPCRPSAGRTIVGDLDRLGRRRRRGPPRCSRATSVAHRPA